MSRGDLESALSAAPPSVRTWLIAQRGDAPADALRSTMCSDVVLHFGPTATAGIDAVCRQISVMMPPDWLADAQWAISTRPGGVVRARGTGPDGTPLPSPGGPMSAIDFDFVLDHAGAIQELAVQPHHLEPPDVAPALQPGERAVDVTLPDVYGTQHRLLDPTAAATVVIFTCNHCPWARGWNARLQRVGRDYASRGVRFLQLNPNDPNVNPVDGLEHSRQRVDAGELAGPYLVDEGQRAARQWGARRTPDVFVLDADAVVVYHGAPDADVADEGLEAAWLRGAIDGALAGVAPEPSVTEPVGCAVNWTLP